MNPRLLQDLNDLVTCDVDEPDELYSRALDSMVGHAGGGMGLYFRAAEVDAALYYEGAVTSNLGEDERDQIDSIGQAPLLDGPTLNIRLPQPREVNRFVHLTCEVNYHGTDVQRQFLEPLEIRSAARIHVYEDRRFVAHLGIYRRGDEPAIRADVLRQLRRSPLS